MATPQPAQQSSTGQNTSIWAILALVFAFVAFIILLFGIGKIEYSPNLLSIIFRFIFPLMGIICGVMALEQIKNNQLKGKGIAIVSIFIGGALILISILLYIGRRATTDV